MSIFSDPTPANAYLKAGFLGFQGSGKTYTAVMLMIGLIEYLRKLGRPEAEKPVYFLDTETGFDYVKRHFDNHNIKTRVARTRAFADLKPAILEAEASGVGLIQDSASHYWTEFMESYMKKTNRKFIQFEDWRFLKKEWNNSFSTLYVNSKLHFIVCGRAGYEYDYHTDEESGKRELEKTGVKMKTESEFGYEPSLLVLMERNVDTRTNDVHRAAHVIKERNSVIDGKTFQFAAPKDKDDGDTSVIVFNAFLPHIKLLNIGGEHIGVDASRNSESMIPGPEGKPEWQHRKEQIVIMLDEIGELVKKHHGGMSEDAKKVRGDVLEKHFGTRSWKRIETFDHDTIKKARGSLWVELEGVPYGFVPPTNSALDAEQDKQLNAAADPLTQAVESLNESRPKVQ